MRGLVQNGKLTGHGNKILEGTNYGKRSKSTHKNKQIRWLAIPHQPKAIFVLGLQPFGLPLPALKVCFSPKGGKNLYQIIINTSVFFSKSQNRSQRQKTFRLWQKYFCPSGSRCFDEYLDYFKNHHPPYSHSQATSLRSFGFSHLLLCACLPLLILIVIKN